jgi:hypothetical protein
LLVVVAMSGCTGGALTVSYDNAQAPAVATSPHRYDFPFSAAVAWRESSENSVEEANQISTLFMFDAPTLPGITTISETSAGTGPVELVRAGEDHYFLGWIDYRDPPARLRWKILSASDWEPIGAPGEFSDPEFVVSDFAAAYHPAEGTVLVAFLGRDDAAYEECVLDEVSTCVAFSFTLPVDGGEVTSATRLPFAGFARGISVAAGADGFLVAVAAGPRSVRHDQNPNRVRIYPFDTTGAPLSSYPHFDITGASDCADDPQSVIDEGDTLTGTLGKHESNFSDTAIAYDARNNRYLVGYTTACNNQYFRARTVERTNAGWIVSGIAETAHTTGGGDSGKEVTAAPIEIAESATEPMLAYNERLHVYLAGYGTPHTEQTIPRQLFETKFLSEDTRTMSGPYEMLEPGKDSLWGFWTYPTFLAGDIVADPEGRAFYAVWEQKELHVPCPNYSEWECSEPNWQGEVTRKEKSKVYFRNIDIIPFD